jgi:hypothetical protein
MLALRTALFLLFQTVTVVPWGLCCLLIAPLPLHLRYRFTIGWTKMVLWAARVICGRRRPPPSTRPTRSDSLRSDRGARVTDVQGGRMSADAAARRQSRHRSAHALSASGR